MGIPTVGGEATFDSSYNGNILVNTFSLGVRTDSIFLGSASGLVPVIYGLKQERTEFMGRQWPVRSSVREGGETSHCSKGDPFIEKLLLEACMEVFQTDAVVESRIWSRRPHMLDLRDGLQSWKWCGIEPGCQSTTGKEHDCL